ncbi:MAG: acid phosphatase AphA [Desulfobacteraceae bacterium]|nr:acid phosphatase AphA [Desulfobacteraceae bacterium]
MVKYIRVVFVFVLFLLITACTTKASLSPVSQDIKYVTVDEIQASLPAKPIVVGFDIDDTVLFSSPGFYYGLNNHDGPGNTNLYGDKPLDSKKFWDDMNGKFDKFSFPKKSGEALVKMHYRRGDKVVFITARPSSEKSIVPQILMQCFGIPRPEVVFTNETPKTQFLRRRGVQVYYGDADSDMRQAREAAARPIRVMRSALSTNTASAYHVGAFGEEVVIHSED